MKHLLHSIRAVIILIVEMFSLMIIAVPAMASLIDHRAECISAVSGAVPDQVSPTALVAAPEATIPEICGLYATKYWAPAISEIVIVITPYREIETISTELMTNCTVTEQPPISVISVRSSVITKLLAKSADNRASPDHSANYSSIESYSPAANHCHLIS